MSVDEILSKKHLELFSNASLLQKQVVNRGHAVNL